MVGISYGAGGNLPGDGLSESTAYLIEDLTDFDVFADPCNSATYWASGVYTKLTCDPNITDRPYTTAVIAPDIYPDGDYFNSTPFEGIFDGNGHTIRNLTIGVGNNYLGLFGRIEGSGAQVKNLGVENINITGGVDSDYLGGLCGRNYHGTINNCYATGSVTGGDNSYHLGGLCGYNRHGSTITNCYAAGLVTGGDDSYGLGGLCGSNGGTITNCYAAGSVIGDDYLGGLCGYNEYGTITNCYATGSVTGGAYSDYLGGLCGYNNRGTITNCFWDVETSGMTDGVGNQDPDPAGVIGKTTEQMQTESTFTDANWDFTVVPVWHMPFEAIGYPILGWQKDIPGDFTGRYGVYMDDFAVLSNAWLSDNAPTVNWNEHCDLNGNGVIDPGDLIIFAEHWLCD